MIAARVNEAELPFDLAKRFQFIDKYPVFALRKCSRRTFETVHIVNEPRAAQDL